RRDVRARADQGPRRQEHRAARRSGADRGRQDLRRLHPHRRRPVRAAQGRGRPLDRRAGRDRQRPRARRGSRDPGRAADRRRRRAAPVMLKHIIDVCVSRRVAVVAFPLGIAVYGFTAYQDTPIEAFPDVTNYQINVITKAPGLAPEEVEKQVTLPLERVLNGTPEVISMRSESLFGLSLIYLTFDDGVDAFRARTRVTERITTAELPEGVTAVLGPEATPLGEIYQFRLASDRHTLQQLRSELDWTVGPRLRQVPGVGDVVSFGGFVPEVHVEVDPARLRAYGLTLGQVTEALAKSNKNVGGGFLRHGDQEMVVRGIG